MFYRWFYKFWTDAPTTASRRRTMMTEVNGVLKVRAARGRFLIRLERFRLQMTMRIVMSHSVSVAAHSHCPRRKRKKIVSWKSSHRRFEYSKSRVPIGLDCIERKTNSHETKPFVNIFLSIWWLRFSAPKTSCNCTTSQGVHNRKQMFFPSLSHAISFHVELSRGKNYPFELISLRVTRWGKIRDCRSVESEEKQTRADKVRRKKIEQAAKRLQWEVAPLAKNVH